MPSRTTRRFPGFLARCRIRLAGLWLDASTAPTHPQRQPRSRLDDCLGWLHASQGATADPLVKKPMVGPIAKSTLDELDAMDGRSGRRLRSILGDAGRASSPRLNGTPGAWW
jgi:hypothetical protein